jgi:hypothetical protein
LSYDSAVSRFIQSLNQPRCTVSKSIFVETHNTVRNKGLSNYKIYEPNLTYFITAKLRPGDTFVDLGEHRIFFLVGLEDRWTRRKRHSGGGVAPNLWTSES